MTCLYPCLSYIPYLRLWVSIQPKVQGSANVSVVLMQVGTAWVRTHQPPCDTDSCYNRSGFKGRGRARYVWGRSHSPNNQEAETNRITCSAQASLGYTEGPCFRARKQANKQKLQIQARPRRAGSCLAAWLVITMLTPASPGERTAPWLPNETNRIATLSTVTLATLYPGKELISGRSKSRRRFFYFLLVGPTSLVWKKMQTLAFARKDVCVFLIYIFKYINIAICKGDKGEIKEVFLRVFTRM